MKQNMNLILLVITIVTDKTKIKNLSKGIERQLGDVVVKHYQSRGLNGIFK